MSECLGIIKGPLSDVAVSYSPEQGTTMLSNHIGYMTLNLDQVEELGRKTAEILRLAGREVSHG